jgi:hypothetical protein
MIKIRIEGTTYYYETKSLYMYKEKVFGGGIYYTPLDYCDIRIKDFIKEKPHTIYTHPEEMREKQIKSIIE